MPKLIIDDSNWKSFQTDVKQADGTFRYGGLKPRSTHPQYGKMMAFADVDIPLIPLEEWPDRIADMTRKRAWAKNVMLEGGAKIKDQNGLGYCFPAGTLVRMADGSEKPIETIVPLDEVVTAECNTGTVLKTMVRRVDEPLYRLHVWGHNQLECTGEHPILTKRGYVPANELVPGDMIAFPRYMGSGIKSIATEKYIEERHYSDNRPYNRRKFGISGRKSVQIARSIVPDVIELTPNFGRLVGFFLAEGHTGSGTLFYSFNREKEEWTYCQEVLDLFKHEFGIEPHKKVRGNNVVQPAIHGVQWAKLFETICGELSYGKRTHRDLCRGPVPFQEAVVSAWIDGDRYRDQCGVTVSWNLAMNMFDMINGSGKNATMYRRDARTGKDGIVHLPCWEVGYHDGVNKGTISEEKHMWRKLREVTTRPFVGAVFNLEVEGDNSYVADGVGVHNCHAYSCTLAIEVQRIAQGHAHVELCPESIGGPVTGWQNQGAWVVDDMMQAAKGGACEKSYQPRDHDISPSDWKSGWKENGLKYRAVEWQEGKSQDWKRQGSVLLAGFGTPNGLNYWGHSVYDCWIEDLHPDLHFSARDRYGFGFGNSWNVTWGDKGFGIRTQSKMPSDEWYVLRQILAG